MTASRDPSAVRGLGAAALAIEALVLLLGIAPLARLGGANRGPAIGVVIVLAVLCVVLAGLLRRSWAWSAAAIVPVALLVGGWLHWSLAVLGVIFGLLWSYVLHVRRSVTATGSASE
jgi:Protein of unknown function (DUF4233)